MSENHNKVLIVEDMEAHKGMIDRAMLGSELENRGLIVVEPEKRQSAVSKYGAFGAFLDMFPYEQKIRTVKPLKKCLQCGNEHRHNNSFCSAECCKTYKQGG